MNNQYTNFEQVFSDTTTQTNPNTSYQNYNANMYANPNNYNTNPMYQQWNYTNIVTENKWWGVLGFFLPMVGLVLLLVWHDDAKRRNDGEIAAKGAVIGFVVQLCLVITVVTLYGVMLSKLLAAATANIIPAINSLIFPLI